MQANPLDVIVGNRNQHPGVGPGKPAAHVPTLHQRVIKAQLDVVVVLPDAKHAAAAATAASFHPHGEDILAVEWKHVTSRQTAVRCQRHVLIHPRGLGLEPELVHLASGTIVGAADCRTTDLGCRRRIPSHQRRRHRQHIRVGVEFQPGHVAWKHLGAINLQRQQILDGVDILQAVHAPGGDTAGVGIGLRLSVQGRLQRSDKRSDGRAVGPRSTGRRHLPGAQFPHDLLQHLRVRAHRGQVDLVKHQTSSLQPLVVTGHAVSVEERPSGRSSRRSLGNRPRLGGCRPAQREGDDRDKASAQSQHTCQPFGGQDDRKRQEPGVPEDTHLHMSHLLESGSDPGGPRRVRDFGESHKD